MNITLSPAELLNLRFMALLIMLDPKLVHTAVFSDAARPYTDVLLAIANDPLLDANRAEAKADLARLFGTDQLQVVPKP